MRLLFAHDHRFLRRNNEIYSTGGLSDDILNRYRIISDDLTVLARIRDSDNILHLNSSIIRNNTNVVNFSFMQPLRATRIIGNSDFVIVRLPSIIGSFVFLVAKVKKKPIMVELVGCAWDSLWNHGVKGKIVAPALTILTKKIVYYSPYTLYVSNVFLQKRYPTRGKYISCSDVELPKLDKSILVQRINRINDMNNRDSIILGTMGAIDVRYKGHEYVIESLPKLRSQGYNVVYQLVGKGDKSRLKHLAQKYGVDEYVQFIGSISHNEVFSWIDSIDIYVQPSRTEGMPRSLIEAMSRGCPAIGSTVGAIPELLNSKYTFPVGNIDILCERLKFIITCDLAKTAKENFRVANDYSKDALDTKRATFYQEWMNCEKNEN